MRNSILNKSIYAILAFCLLNMIFVSCGGKSTKTIIRMQKMEEGVQNPTSVEELEAAIKKYQDRATDLQLTESQIGIWYKMLATRYLDSKMYDKAMDSLKKAIEFYPANQNLYYWVGVCANHMAKASLDFNARGQLTNGKTQEAWNYIKLSESSYLRALELDDRNARTLYGLSLLYVFDMKEYEKAISLLEKLITIEKKNFDALFVLAGAYYAVGEGEKAVAIYERIPTMTKSKEIIASAESLKKQVLDSVYSK